MGNFKNAGSVWAQTPQAVNDHDFRSQADAKAAASPAKEDPEAGLEFTPPAVAAAEGASGAYTVHLSSEPTAPVTVTLTQPTNTDVRVDTDPSTGGNQNTLSFTPANWSTPQRVTVSVDEDDDAVNEEATIGHAASGTEAYEGVSGEVEVGVKDNDAPGAGLQPDLRDRAGGQHLHVFGEGDRAADGASDRDADTAGEHRRDGRHGPECPAQSGGSHVHDR